jgi:predicted transcriptional regulator
LRKETGYDMIHRTQKHKGRFTIIDKALIYDNKLSAKAKGIMQYILSQADDWQFYETEICQHFKDGEDGISSGIKELIDNGYINRTKTRDKGKIKYIYEIYESPINTNIIVPQPEGIYHSGKTTINNNDINKNKKPIKYDATKPDMFPPDVIFCPDCSRQMKIGGTCKHCLEEEQKKDKELGITF